ncbi:MAG: REP-associated tyrosine transposase [Gammaproteobacteria bacterium]
MSSYKRIFQAGSYYFFTVVTYDRLPVFKRHQNVTLLKESIKKIKCKYPFQINAWVILPDHIHMIWKLPRNDFDYTKRWRLIKREFCLTQAGTTNKRNERRIWQRRYWEHIIRNENDMKNHIDYIHFNPVKHGYTSTPSAWEYSSFQYWLNKGVYHIKWGCAEPKNLTGIELE